MIIHPLNYEAHKSRLKLPIIDSYERNSPTGLFSPNIFGVTEEDTTSKAALISLGCYVMRPLVVQAFRRINRKFVQCLTESKEFYIRNGLLYEVDNNFEQQPNDLVGYGPMFLYMNWDKLDHKQFNTTTGRFSNIELKKSIDKLNRDEIFKAYEYVIPIAFRDEKTESGPMINDWNNMYTEVIRYSNHIKTMRNNRIAGVNIDLRDYEVYLQRAVNAIGDYIKDSFFGPHGIGRKQILSRNVDNGARMVIIPTVWKKPKLRQGRIGMRASGVPIAFLLNMFRETIIKFSKTFIDDLFDRGYFEPKVTSDYLAYYDIEFISKAIENMTDQYFRVTNFPAIKTNYEFGTIMMDMKLIDGDNTTSVKKPLTWTEFFYIVVERYAKLYETRMIAITRPPVDSMQSLQPQKPVSLTLNPNLTKTVEIWGETYDEFPYIDENLKTKFQDQIFDTGSRLIASVTTAFNGKMIAPIYSNMCR